MSFIKNLSVFITRIHRDDANEEYIKRVFYEQEIAHVRRIDFIKRRDTGEHKRTVYYQAKIYFHYWFKNEIAYNLQQRILNPNNYGGRVVYADPWYWIVLKNKNPMTEMELCVNERLEDLEYRMKKQTRKMADIETNVEKLMKQPSNTHIRYMYADDVMPVSTNYEKLAEETAKECAEAVLAEEPVTPEWEEYGYGYDGCLETQMCRTCNNYEWPETDY